MDPDRPSLWRVWNGNDRWNVKGHYINCWGTSTFTYTYYILLIFPWMLLYSLCSVYNNQDSFFIYKTANVMERDAERERGGGRWERDGYGSTYSLSLVEKGWNEGISEGSEGRSGSTSFTCNWKFHYCRTICIVKIP